MFACSILLQVYFENTSRSTYLAKYVGNTSLAESAEAVLLQVYLKYTDNKYVNNRIYEDSVKYTWRILGEVRTCPRTLEISPWRRVLRPYFSKCTLSILTISTKIIEFTNTASSILVEYLAKYVLGQER